MKRFRLKFLNQEILHRFILPIF